MICVLSHNFTFNGRSECSSVFLLALQKKVSFYYYHINRARRWYTVVTLLDDMCWGVGFKCFFDVLLSTYLCTYQCTYQCTYLPIYLPMYSPIYLPMYPLMYLPMYLPIFRPMYLPIDLGRANVSSRPKQVNRIYDSFVLSFFLLRLHLLFVLVCQGPSLCFESKPLFSSFVRVLKREILK